MLEWQRDSCTWRLARRRSGVIASALASPSLDDDGGELLEAGLVPFIHDDLSSDTILSWREDSSVPGWAAAMLVRIMPCSVIASCGSEACENERFGLFWSKRGKIAPIGWIFYYYRLNITIETGRTVRVR